MIVNDPEDGVVECVAQAEHARHAGSLAEALAAPPEPREPLAEATACHDDGWIPYDREPGWNAETGLPHTYRSIPTGDYVEVWRRGVDEALERGPYVGLLVSLHGTPFLARRDHSDARAFVEEQRGLQEDLLADLGYGGSWDDPPEAVADHRAWMGFLDALSLFLLDRWESPWRAEVGGRTLTASREGRRGTVEPWPFREEVLEGEVPAVLLRDAPYGSTEAMTAALASAPRGTRSLRLEAPGRFADPPAKP